MKAFKSIVLSTSHLSCVFVNQVEDSILLGVPVEPLTDALPPLLGCDDLQRVHFDRLLYEYHIVL